MPVAENSPSSVERFDLETAPPDGYVVLKRLDHGQLIDRREMASKIKFEAEQRQGRRKFKERNKATPAELEMASAIVTEFEFRICIVEHNLTQLNGQPFDFKHDLNAWRRLDPKIGEEISFYIGEMNNWEPDLAKGDNPSEDGPLQVSSEDGSSSVVLPIAQRPAPSST